MNSLKKEGSFNLSEKSRSYITNYFSSDSATDEEVNDIILQYYTEYNITLDPHTAVGVACGKKQSIANDILVTLSTAHPAKFKETVSKIISNNSFITKKVRNLDTMEENMMIANNKIKNLEISDDLKSNLEIDTQDLTDKYIKKVDEMYSLKEKDILTL